MVYALGGPRVRALQALGRRQNPRLAGVPGMPSGSAATRTPYLSACGIKLRTRRVTLAAMWHESGEVGGGEQEALESLVQSGIRYVGPRVRGADGRDWMTSLLGTMDAARVWAHPV